LVIGIFSLGYVLYRNVFAEFHISLPFLDFPIFVGEILIFLCSVLSIGKYLNKPLPIKKEGYFVIVYFIFVLLKAVFGYLKWGPLAFRHAALFYYLVFIFFGYLFYYKGYFERKRIMALFFLTIFLLFRIGNLSINTVWLLTIFLLSIILIKSYPNCKVKCFMVLVLLASTPYKYFFKTNRMMMVSSFVAGVFVILSLSILIRTKRNMRYAIVLLGTILMIVSFLNFTNKNILKSMFDFQTIGKVYHRRNDIVRQRINEGYVMKEIDTTVLYNPFYKKRKDIFTINVTEHLFKDKGDAFKLQDRLSKENIEQYFSDEILKRRARLVGNEKDGLGVKDANLVFRLMICRDMFVEMIEKKPALGFDFGKPLRSISLEILNWADEEWARDGWISAHNSHFHMFYRAGLLGILLVLTIFMHCFAMARSFIRLRSTTGILLCGIIISWLVAANFMPILELPYTAIPIWIIYGLTLAYCQNIKKEKEISLNSNNGGNTHANITE